MSLVTTVLAEAAHTELPMPTIVYGLIAVVAFTALGFVTWSYRDVANRHSHKTGAGSHDSHGHGH
ncbi:MULTISPECIES: hypothetical protein [Rathayibacter]|uniref:4-hydroxybenzoate polyprenyltransferase n=2 Tax=Rathayibacter festucae TaxID=110937 RepID=A0A3Q9UQ81_9MICO|nr:MULTISPECIES: hypothetical protein [Rathayibacter]AZZ51549.1 hypothetical protein C1I64_05495 [Rathayibacter festucae DSM 15932]MCJ1673290.1 hypothetical protein [Rathayibacter sp. VKM Ac-2929]MCJ1682961.1 hypothetical protein [Rathayibacter sp. VKM Ac-2928]MCJ1687707.1 hypothetical protein [Rathayibacter sp. VKM Ac-2927]MCJ1700068.1 hypothetical protein [Rathayibacter festucae]